MLAYLLTYDCRRYVLEINKLQAMQDSSSTDSDFDSIAPLDATLD